MIKAYRKKPVMISAVQLTAENIKEVADWCNGQVRKSILRGGKHIEIQTFEGKMAACIGDYVIKGIKGEFYPCKSDIFEATYTEVL